MHRRNEILVGVDGSDTSLAAVSWAAREARARCCALGIVHAADPASYGLWTLPWPMREGLRDSCRPIVETARAVAHRTGPLVPVHTRVLVGPAAPLLVALSQRVELVVVGRSGHGTLSRELLGSVPYRLVANAHCPTVAVGWPPSAPAGAGQPLSRVVAAVGDLDGEPATLRFAVDTGRRRGVPVYVLRALPPRRPVLAEYRRLDEELEAWRERSPDIELWPDVRSGPLPEVIANASTPGDLLLLGHHRPASFTPHVVGARTRDAIDAAPCPVAVVHELLAEARSPALERPARQLERSLA